jgi:hypothetical protein
LKDILHMQSPTAALLDRKTAAEHCGIAESYLANLAKARGAGPAFIKVSPRKTMYARVGPG